MTKQTDIPVIDMQTMRDKVAVFSDRRAAGQVLADMLKAYAHSQALVLGIPAGGLTVAAVIASKLQLELDVAVVNKITPPWNSEWGFGAVVFDGSVLLNRATLASLGMDDQTVQSCIDVARSKVQRRLKLLGAEALADTLAAREIILVDDGLATGITMRGAIEGLCRARAQRIIVALPTAHGDSIERLIGRQQIQALYCPNIRSGYQFAVAEAYLNWRDLTDNDVAQILSDFRSDKVK